MIKQELEKAFSSAIIEATASEFRANCPKCKDESGRADSKFHLYVNPYKKRKNNVSGLLEIGTWICFRCSWKGWGIDKLGADVTDTSSSAHSLSSLLELIDDSDREGDNILLELNQGVKKANNSPKGIEFPKGYTTDWSGSITGQAAFNYLTKKRGASVEQIKKCKMGYCRSGVYAGFLILPIFEENVLVYYVARSIFDKVYKNAPVSSKNILFNFDKQLDTICLVEGIFDALAIGRFGVALLGKTLKEAQAQRIIEAKPKNVYVCLDSDASQNAINIVNRLKDYIDNVVIVTLGNGKDPNSSSKKELLEAFKSASKISTNMDTLKWMLDNGGS